MPEIKKILIIRLSSFGDIVLTYPFITYLRNKFPDAKIDYLTKNKFASLVNMHDEIDYVISYGGEKISELRDIIDRNKYDLIFDIHKNLRSIFSTIFLNTKKFRYKKDTMKKLLLVVFKINLIKNVIPVYKKYLLVLNRGFKLESLEYLVTDLNFKKERIIDEPYILIAPSSKHFTKTFPKEKFGQIIKEFENKKFVIIGDNTKEDIEICNYLGNISANVINFCAKTNFNNLANLVNDSQLVICNDSGVLHLAEALNKKVITFFGSTVKEFGFYPNLNSTLVFENNNLRCRPCTHIGKSKCPKKHFKCMNDINIKEVIKKINENIS